MAVTVFTTSNCPFCIKVKEYLDTLNLQYETIDLSIYKLRQKEIVEKTKQRGVPVTQIDDEYIVGFNKDKIMDTLIKKKYYQLLSKKE